MRPTFLATYFLEQSNRQKKIIHSVPTLPLHLRYIIQSLHSQACKLITMNNRWPPFPPPQKPDVKSLDDAQLEQFARECYEYGMQVMQHQLLESGKIPPQRQPLSFINKGAAKSFTFKTRIQLGDIVGVHLNTGRVVHSTVSALKDINFPSDGDNSSDSDTFPPDCTIGYLTRFFVETMLPREYLLRIARRSLKKSSSTKTNGTMIQINYGDGYGSKILIQKDDVSQSPSKRRRSSMGKVKQTNPSARICVRICCEDEGNGDVGIDPSEKAIDVLRTKLMFRQHEAGNSLHLIPLVLRTGPVCWDTDDCFLDDKSKMSVTKVWYSEDDPGLACGVQAMGTQADIDRGEINGNISSIKTNGHENENEKSASSAAKKQVQTNGKTKNAEKPTMENQVKDDEKVKEAKEKDTEKPQTRTKEDDTSKGVKRKKGDSDTSDSSTTTTTTTTKSPIAKSKKNETPAASTRTTNSQKKETAELESKEVEEMEVDTIDTSPAAATRTTRSQKKETAELKSKEVEEMEVDTIDTSPAASTRTTRSQKKETAELKSKVVAPPLQAHQAPVLQMLLKSRRICFRGRRIKQKEQ